MTANIDDIQRGMDVYGSDSEKIGTVHGVFLGGTGTGGDSGSSRARSGGGPGTLGDETRVSTDTGTAGGPGDLGDESRVYSDTGTGGGPGALGDESAVDSEYGAAEAGSGAAGGTTGATSDAGISSGIGGMGSPEVIEEVVVAETVEMPDIAIGGPGTGYGSDAYFEVDHGGFLGLGAQHLHIPYSEVQSVEPDKRVTLNCTKDECLQRYQTAAHGS